MDRPESWGIYSLRSPSAAGLLVGGAVSLLGSLFGLKCPSIRADKLMGGTGSLRNQERGLQMVLANTSVHAVEGALPKGCC